MNLKVTLKKNKYIFVAFINNADNPNRFSFDGHPSSTTKFLGEQIKNS